MTPIAYVHSIACNVLDAAYAIQASLDACTSPDWLCVTKGEDCHACCSSKVAEYDRLLPELYAVACLLSWDAAGLRMPGVAGGLVIGSTEYVCDAIGIWSAVSGAPLTLSDKAKLEVIYAALN